jgi:hypothetical protein
MGMDGWLRGTLEFYGVQVALATMTHAGRPQRREGHPGYY